MCQIATTTTDRPDRKAKSQGQNWLSRRTRLGIYLRDKFSCAYCGKGVECGIVLTLDHVKPYSKGGAVTDAKNLVTACRECNSARGNRSVKEFAQAVAVFHQRSAEDILAEVQRRVRRVVNKKAAGALLAERGSCRKVLDVVQQGDALK
jgi:hypothetical protein